MAHLGQRFRRHQPRRAGTDDQSHHDRGAVGIEIEPEPNKATSGRMLRRLVLRVPPCAKFPAPDSAGSK
jgi:hypothetical protein